MYTTGRENKSTSLSLSPYLSQRSSYLQESEAVSECSGSLGRPPSIHRHDLPLFVIVIGPFIIAMTTRGVLVHATGKNGIREIDFLTNRIEKQEIS